MLTTHNFLSPSLQSTHDSPPAHEVKFVLSDEQAWRVEHQLQAVLIPDPHTQLTNSNGVYCTTTVYCDTPGLDIFHRHSGFTRRKYRVRRYGLAESLFLEQKTKDETQVQKRRTIIPQEELARLQSTNSDFDWEGGWFHESVTSLHLAPVLAVMYDRTAYVGQSLDGPLRLTFDRSIRAVSTTHWGVAPFSGGHAIMADRVICEFKFRGPLPSVFKAVMARERLSPASASKYRMGLQAARQLVPATNATQSGVPHA